MTLTTAAAMVVAAIALVALGSAASAHAAGVSATPGAQAAHGRWVVVSAPGLRLRDLPSPISAELAERGVTGLLPAVDAAMLGRTLRRHRAPVLDGSSERDLTQLAEWVAAPPDSVGIPQVAVVDLGTGPAKTGAVLGRDLERVAAMLSSGSSLGVVVVSPSVGLGASSLTPVIAALVPPGAAGVPSPATTRRQGIVSALDILEAVAGPPAAASLVDRPALTRTSLQVRTMYLEGIARSVAAVDRARWTVIGLYVSAFLLLLALAALAVWSGRGRRAASLALLVPLVVPVAGYGAALFLPIAVGPEQVYLVIGGITLLLTFVAAAAWARLGPLHAAGALLAFTASVVVADQLMGAPLLAANVFGYSLADGARFYGLGNEGAGLLLASVTTSAVLFSSGDESRSWRTSAVAALAFGSALAVCVSPWWGANLGVAVWGSVLVLVAWSGLLPASASRRVWAAAGVLAAVAVTFVACDAGTGMTHVGRAVRSVAASGTGVVWEQLAGRTDTAVRTLTTNPWTIVLLALLLVLAWVRYRPPARIAALLAGDHGLRAYVTASIVASLVAMVVEDTGGSVAAYLVPLALLVVLLRLLEPGAEEAAAEPRPGAQPDGGRPS
jgi:hypothetical protein